METSNQKLIEIIDQAYTSCSVEHIQKHTLDEFKISHLEYKSLKLNLSKNPEINRLKISANLLNNQVEMSNSPQFNLFDSAL